MQDKNPQNTDGLGRGWKRFPSPQEIVNSLFDDESISKEQAELILKHYLPNFKKQND